MQRLKSSLLAAALLSACAFAAAAQSAPADAAAPAGSAQTGSVTSDAPRESSAANDSTQAAAKNPRRDPTCLTQTGSRVQARGNTTCAGYGRSYSREDLDHTGEVDVGQALRKLDPRLY